jgi:hypothetical protein
MLMSAIGGDVGQDGETGGRSQCYPRSKSCKS